MTSKFTSCLILELFSLKCLTESPVWWSNIVGGYCSSSAGGDLERERLSGEVEIALPVLSPVPTHGYPPCLRSLHFDSNHFPIRAYIGDEDLIVEGSPVNGKPYSPTSLTLYPAQLMINMSTCSLCCKVFLDKQMSYLFSYLLYWTGTMSALFSAISAKAASDISKCARGKLHHPP